MKCMGGCKRWQGVDLNFQPLNFLETPAMCKCTWLVWVTLSCIGCWAEFWPGLSPWQCGYVDSDSSFPGVAYLFIFFSVPPSWTGIESQLYNEGVNLSLWTGNIMKLRMEPTALFLEFFADV